MNLPKKNRLKTSKIIDQVFKDGKKFVTEGFVFYMKKIKGQLEPKVAFIASKKVGSAVERNKAKRKMREAVYNNIKDFPASSAVVVVLRKSIVDADTERVEDLLCKILEKIK